MPKRVILGVLKWATLIAFVVLFLFLFFWIVSSSLKNETGEGGTMALGNDIPAVNRDRLHALPEAVWSSERARYIYETWVDRAEAAIRSGAP